MPGLVRRGKNYYAVYRIGGPHTTALPIPRQDRGSPSR